LKKNRAKTVFGVFVFFMIVAMAFPNPSCERSMPDYYVPGKALQVKLSVDPASDALAWVVEDSPPEAWTVSEISAGGVWDNVNKKVKWGLFLDNNKRDFSYTLIPPKGEKTQVQFKGLVSVNGADFSTQGAKTSGSGIEQILNYLLDRPGGKRIDPNMDNKTNVGDILYLLK